MKFLHFLNLLVVGMTIGVFLANLKHHVATGVDLVLIVALLVNVVAITANNLRNH